MHHLHWRKIAVAAILLTTVYASNAQRSVELNLPDHDDKPYYFGIILGFNSSHYNITHHPYFLQRDTISVVESKNSNRIHLGIMANLQLTKHLDLRAYPLNLIFSEKVFGYTQKLPSETSSTYEKQSVESIVMSFPFQVRLKSDRINNFRVYTLAGMKYDFDLASNSGARNSDNIVKVNKTDYGLEGGIGFQFFFPYFILSPEIKFSYGLSNVHSRDESLRYSNVIDKMNSRMILFSLHFEGGGTK
ncbi:MAG: outer membrane beta-barrel protein [bacterium]|jgi:hypothetical protein